MPITLGVKIANEEDFDEELKKLSALLTWGGTHEKRVYDYKGVGITHIKFAKSSNIADEVNRNRDPDEPLLEPSLYYAKIDGFFQIGFREEPIKSLIEQSVTRGSRVAKDDELAQGNSAIHLAPSASQKAR